MDYSPLISFPLPQLSTTAVVLTLALVVLALPLFFALYNIFLHPLARAGIPYSSIWDITTPWPVIYSSLVKGKRHVEVHERQKIVGEVMRTGRNEVVLSDPAWNRIIMGSKFAKVTNHHELRPDGKAAKLFFNHDHHVAAGKRKAVVPHYAAHQMPIWDGKYQEHFGKLLQVFQRLSGSNDNGRGIDITPLFRLTCIDIGGHIIMGTHLGTMDAYLRGRDTGLGDQTKIAFYRSLCASMLPGAVWWIAERMPGMKWQEIVQSERVIQDYYTPIIKVAMNRPLSAGERACTAQRLKATIDHHTRLPWAEEHIIEECIDHIMVSPEPTGVGTYALWLLAAHPNVQDKLLAEVKAHGLDKGDVASIRVVGEMEYLLAILKETIRLYPAAPGPRLRVLGPEGLTVGQYHIPGGTAVGVQVWTAHRSEDIWGLDAAVFRPERFLEELTPQQTTAFSPFSSGNRPCPGQNFASATLRVSVASIIHSFELRPAASTTPESMEPRDWGTLIPASGECRLMFTPRE